MGVGRISFGPRQTPEEAAESLKLYRDAAYVRQAAPGDARSCFCVGPQPGETKCPCQLAGDARQARSMLTDGIEINGVIYDLVPRKRP